MAGSNSGGTSLKREEVSSRLTSASQSWNQAWQTGAGSTLEARFTSPSPLPTGK